MKKSSLKGMMSRVIIYSITVLLSSLFCWREADAQVRAKTVCLTVTDGFSAPLYGVYVVDTRNRLLVTTTDEEGQCKVLLKGFSAKDTLEFSCLGFYAKRMAVDSLHDGQVIVLQERSILLEEVAAEGIHPWDLLKGISKEIKKKKEKVKGYRYFGNGQYEKITECNERIVEYRREYGCFATTGNTKKRGTFDRGGEYGFVPKYAARSYPLTVDGTDTLVPLYQTEEKLFFESGKRRVFEFIRVVELYGPLFGGMKDYDFKQIETESGDYTFQFKTKKSRYPNKTFLSCQGTLTIDRRTRKLKVIDFDYVEYALCNQPRWARKIMKEIFFSSQAELKFKYWAEGEYCVESCTMETTWKSSKTGKGRYGTLPSRIEPLKNKLIEKEAFACNSYYEVPAEGRNSAFIFAMGIGSYNPQGEYNAHIFSRLPELLDSKQAFQDLNQYMDIEKQFKRLSNRAYYPVDYLLASPWRWSSILTRGEGVVANFNKIREMMLLCFFTGWRNPLGDEEEVK